MALAKKWHLEESLSAVQVAKRLGHSPSTISRLVTKRRPRKVQGRKPLLTEGMVDKLEAKVEAMIQKADSEYEVTVTMLKRVSRWAGRRRCTAPIPCSPPVRGAGPGLAKGYAAEMLENSCPMGLRKLRPVGCVWDAAFWCSFGAI